jgi:predicted RNase H-like nuclease
MLHAKRSVAGAAERDALLANVFGDIFAELRTQIPKRLAADDDIRDALVAAWSAGRIADGRAESITAEGALDPTGLKMEMRA